ACKPVARNGSRENRSSRAPPALAVRTSPVPSSRASDPGGHRTRRHFMARRTRAGGQARADTGATPRRWTVTRFLAVNVSSWYDIFLLSADGRERSDTMRKVEEVVAWVVYTMTPHGKQIPVNGICEQGEWDAMQV